MGEGAASNRQTHSARMRPMQTGDLDPVLAIARASFPRPWSRQQFESGLKAADSDYVVVEDGDAVVAYICGWRVADEVQIHDVAVHPDHRRRGHGERLVRAVMDRGAGAGARRATLEVRPSNLGARALYRRLVFFEVGIRPRLYADGEDALLMESTLTAGYDREEESAG